MGLLDDAIKEHLELKRRHGADPGEVARLEHEALGPARREPVSAAPEAEEAAVEEPVAREPVEEAPAGESFYDYEDDEVPSEERLEAPVHRVEPEPEPEPREPEPREPEPELAAEPEPREPEPELAAEPEPDLPPVEQPTRQFSLEELEAASQAPADADEVEEAEADEPTQRAPEADVVPADDEPEGDDVLEETPEFLQETPEHDRLWFEQKPPRDFDF